MRTCEPTLADPRRLVVERRLRLDAQARRARQALMRLTPDRRARIDRSALALRRLLPEPEALRNRVERAGAGLQSGGRARFEAAHRDLEAQAAQLHALSPLGVLGRGYALVRREDGRIARDAAELQPQERLQVRLARGTARVVVEESRDEEEKS
jgi:exodeoxyribonuclease VII large subunit